MPVARSHGGPLALEQLVAVLMPLCSEVGALQRGGMLQLYLLLLSEMPLQLQPLQCWACATHTACLPWLSGGWLLDAVDDGCFWWLDNVMSIRTVVLPAADFDIDMCCRQCCIRAA